MLSLILKYLQAGNFLTRIPFSQVAPSGPSQENDSHQDQAKIEIKTNHNQTHLSSTQLNSTILTLTPLDSAELKLKVSHLFFARLSLFDIFVQIPNKTLYQYLRS